MTSERFDQLVAGYARLRLAVVGDFCLDRYLEIDPARQERSIETGRPVHNVVNVRGQPGGAGTILNNLSALGVGALYPVGFAGDDGEGLELLRALQARRGVRLDHFITTPLRRTFTYCKPLVLEPGRPPLELDRLDSKNWTPTPSEVETEVGRAMESLAGRVDAMIILDQVDVADTGVITARVLEVLGQVAQTHPNLWILADSRRGLRAFPPVCYKMNRTELAALTGTGAPLSDAEVFQRAAALAQRNGRPVFVSLAEAGLLGATPEGKVHHVPALPVRGAIDIVGAGDAVTANLAAALAAGATLVEALEMANVAASVVVHQLGTTGAATPREIRALLM